MWGFLLWSYTVLQGFFLFFSFSKSIRLALGMLGPFLVLFPLFRGRRESKEMIPFPPSALVQESNFPLSPPPSVVCVCVRPTVFFPSLFFHSTGVFSTDEEGGGAGVTASLFLGCVVW